MQSVFEACTPRDEVLTGELREEMFAARLRDVIEKHADPVYQDPSRFFANTYPTEGLRTLATEALGRLTGAKPGNNAILRLETAFGGGKTHNLIALYHLASGATPSEAVAAVVGGLPIPGPDEVTVAGVVGTDLDAENGVKHGDLSTRTLWGELAWQIGGAAGYELVRESDRSFAAPGGAFLERLVERAPDRPLLILLDEIARHLRAAGAVATATGGSTLAQQTIAFLVSLFEFAASRERVVVVLTLADSSDAFGAETDSLRTELAEARKVAARVERVITPTGETEISSIVTHRLFRSIDRAAATATAREYAAAYRRLLDQGAELPERAVRPEYAEELATDYPFHPELLTTLTRKVATIPNFQKTRGALRLLAMVVRDLWDRHPDGTVIIGADMVNLGVDAIADDLTSRLDRPAFKQVIAADIVSPQRGSLSHAQELDRASSEAAKPALAGRVATAIFLHSLTQGTASGVDPADLAVAVVRPGEDPLLVARATEQLVDTCWFLDWDGHRLRFKTEASLNKVIADEAALVGTTKAKEEIDRRIRDGLIWKKGTFRPIAFPSEPADVDDDAGPPKLVIVHYDAASTTAGATTVPDLVRRLQEHAGSAEGFRQYRNNLVFLVADADEVGRLVEVAKRYLALARIAGSSERMGEFNTQQRGKLKDLAAESELNLRLAITRTYRYLYYPAADAPQRDAGLARESLPAQDQGDVKDDQSLVILRTLRTLQKVLTGDDPPLAPAYVRAKAWDANQTSLSTEDLRRAFARRTGLRMLLDEQQLRRTIRDGIANGTWVYFEAGADEGYGSGSPPPLPRISEDALLYTSEEAARLGLRLKGEKPVEELCPVCHNPIADCTCGTPPPPAPGTSRPHAEGAPAQVLQSLADQARDAKMDRIGTLTLAFEGSDKAGADEVVALGLAVPQLGRLRARVRQVLTLQFGPGDDLQVRFAGDWDRYKRLKSVTEPFAKEAAKLDARTTLELTFPEGLEPDGPAFGELRDVLVALGFGRIVADAAPWSAPGSDTSQGA